MATISGLLNAYFTDVKGNMFWDLTKEVWKTLTNKSWEELYLDAFDSAWKDEGQRLAGYGDGFVDLPREEVHRILHQKLSASVLSMSPSELTNDEFSKRLVNAFAEQESLIIGGHRLSPEDYVSLIQNVVRKAIAKFNATIKQNPVAFQQAVIGEAKHLSVSIENIQAYLKDRFDNDVLLDLKEISSRTQQIQNTGDATFHDVQELKTELAELRVQLTTITVTDSEKNRQIEEKFFDEQIDAAVQLLQEGKPLMAKERLKVIFQDINSKSFSNELRYRLLTNIGACHLSLGENVTGADHLARALSYSPNHPKALANAGLAALLYKNYDEAIQKANQSLNLEPIESTALSVLIEASFRLGIDDQLDEQIILKAEQNTDSRRTLANMLTERQELERAEQLCRLNLQSSEAEAQDSFLLAQVLVAKVQMEERNGSPLPWYKTSSSRKKLQEAESLLQEVIDIWSKSESQWRYHNALVSRASVRGMLGKDDLALSDCQIVLATNPNHIDALYNGGLAAFQLENYTEAILLLKRMPDSPKNFIVEQIIASSYIQQKLPAKAIEILSEPNEQIPLKAQLDRYRLLVDAAHSVGDDNQINKIVESLKERESNSPEILEVLGSIRYIQGLTDEAQEYLYNAYTASENIQKKYYAFRLAEFYYFQQRYDNAVPLYEEAEVPIVNIPATHRYLISQLNSGNWKRAYELAQEIRGDAPVMPIVSEVEVRIAQFIDDLDQAEYLYLQLREIEPTNPEHFIGLALIYLRRDEIDKVRGVLEPVIERFSDNPEALIAIAQILARTDYPIDEIIKLAYKARNRGLDNAHIQMLYFWIFLHMEKESGLLDPQEVEIDTAVQVYSDGQTKWYVILDDKSADSGRGELHKTDPLAQKLLGLKKNEAFILTKHPMRNVTAEIKDIQSKFVRAFQETATDYNVRFPNESDLIRLPISLNDSDNILYVPLPSSDHIKMAFDSYTIGNVPLTIGSIAQFMSRNVIEIWEELAFSRTGKIKGATGHDNERRSQAQLISVANKITLEPTALFTLWQLGFLEKLANRFDEIYVAQSLLDELNSLLFEREFHGRDGAKFLGSKDGLPQFTEISSEQVQQNIQKVEELKTFVKTNCSTTPVFEILELGKASYEKHETLLGRSQLDSILIAKQTNSPLYSDDFWLRFLAHKDFSVRGAWTQAMLNEFAQRKLIELEDYYNAVTQMILFNYQVVFINKDTLVHVLETHKWQISPQVESVFLGLSETAFSDSYVIGEFTHLLERVWYSPFMLERKAVILDLCLRTLIKNRNAWKVINDLRSELDAIFYLAPIQQDEVSRQVDLWIRMHLR